MIVLAVVGPFRKAERNGHNAMSLSSRRGMDRTVPREERLLPAARIH